MTALTDHYALIKSGIVQNIACVDASTPNGQSWLAAVQGTYDHVLDVETISPRPEIGWVYNGMTFLPAQTLTSSTSTLAANGSNTATITYTDNTSAPPTEVTFTVNGAQVTQPVTNGVATLVVKASAVGPIEITCGDQTLTLEAS